MLTTRTITHSFLNADGTTASGRVTFNLSSRITNGTTTVVPVEVAAQLDASGAISVALVANDDAGTAPAGSTWRCTLRILGISEEESYAITVPSAGSGAIDLGTLLPGIEQVD